MISASGSISDFHRLLIFNEKNELLVVKIKDKPFWVTTGRYDKGELSAEEGLHLLAKNYGFEISKPRFVGKFDLLNDKEVLSVRHFYTAKVKSGKLKLPKGIESGEWLSINESYNRVTFPHINLLTKHVLDNPDDVWAATVRRYKEGDQFKAEIIEPFYRLSED